MKVTPLILRYYSLLTCKYLLHVSKLKLLKSKIFVVRYFYLHLLDLQEYLWAIHCYAQAKTSQCVRDILAPFTVTYLHWQGHYPGIILHHRRYSDAPIPCGVSRCSYSFCITVVTVHFWRIKFTPGPIMGCLLCASELVAHGSFTVRALGPKTLWKGNLSRASPFRNKGLFQGSYQRGS